MMIKFGTDQGEVDLNKFWEKKGSEKLLALANELLSKFELPGGALWLANRIYEEAEEMRQVEVGQQKLKEIEDSGVLTYPSQVKNEMDFKEAVEFLTTHSPVTYSAYSPDYLGMIKVIDNQVVFLNGEMRVVSAEDIDPTVLLLENWKICAQVD